MISKLLDVVTKIHLLDFAINNASSNILREFMPVNIYVEYTSLPPYHMGEYIMHPYIINGYDFSLSVMTLMQGGSMIPVNSTVTLMSNYPMNVSGKSYSKYRVKYNKNHVDLVKQMSSVIHVSENNIC